MTVEETGTEAEVKQEPKTDEPDPLLTFLAYIKKQKSFEIDRPFIRVMPKGLFVDERKAETVIALYQRWITEQSDGLATKAHDKAWLRLFGGEHPERFYVVEGKNTLTGHVIPFTIKAPQQYGLPYYLGSALSAVSNIHASDPMLTSLKDVEVLNTQRGTVLKVISRKQEIEIPMRLLERFSIICKFSRFAASRKVFENDPLVVKARLLVSLVKRSRPIKKDSVLLVPERYTAFSKNTQIRIAANFVLITEGKELKLIYELAGRNLGEFLRHELLSGRYEKLGSFQLARRHEKILGVAQIKDLKIGVHPKAFTEFVEYIIRAKEPRERFNKLYSPQDCFERFQSFFQLAEKVPVSRFADVLRSYDIQARDCRAYGAWLFPIEQGYVIRRVVAKHIRLPGARRKGRG